MYVILTLFLTFFFSNIITIHLFSLVILIHGSFATHAPWLKPKNAFFDNLSATARSHMSSSVMSFYWSGRPTYQAIFTAGQQLAQLLLFYPPDEKIILIGHSHGGNVIALASQFLTLHSSQLIAQYHTFGNCSDIFELSSGGIIVQKERIDSDQRQKQITTPLAFDMLATTRSTKKQLAGDISDKKIISMVASFIHLRQKIRSLQTRTGIRKTYAIDAVYLLGTPIDKRRYKQDMNAINFVYNLYSKGDMIQPVAGLFKRTLPSHPRVANLSITIEGGDPMRAGLPSHSQLHCPLLGTWLLQIPETCIEKKCDGFADFAYQNGCIHFDQRDQPHYKRDKKGLIHGSNLK